MVVFAPTVCVSFTTLETPEPPSALSKEIARTVAISTEPGKMWPKAANFK